MFAVHGCWPFSRVKYFYILLLLMLVKSNASEKALSQTLTSTSITEAMCNKVYVNKSKKQILCLYRVFRNATCGQLNSAFCVLFLVQPC